MMIISFDNNQCDKGVLRLASGVHPNPEDQSRRPAVVVDAMGQVLVKKVHPRASMKLHGTVLQSSSLSQPKNLNGIYRHEEGRV